MSKIILIVDGDLAIFRNAAVIEKRSVLVTHLPSHTSKVFSNRTAFKDFLAAKGREYVELDYLIEDQQEAQDPVVAFRLVRGLFDKMQTAVAADEVEVYVGNDEPTFREKLPLPSPYKDNRADLIKPLNLKATKQFVKKHYGFDTFEGLETDDVVTIRCYEEIAKGNLPILATLDKDAWQSQGITLLDWTKEGYPLELVPDLGDMLWRKQKEVKGKMVLDTKVRGLGLRYLAYQILAGDTTDTYKPYELSKVKYGSIKAMTAVNSATTKAEVFEVIENQYQLLYPEPFEYTDCHGVIHSATWEDMLSLYFKCAYMKRSWDDPSDYWKFKEQQLAN